MINRRIGCINDSNMDQSE